MKKGYLQAFGIPLAGSTGDLSHLSHHSFDPGLRLLRTIKNTPLIAATRAIIMSIALGKLHHRPSMLSRSSE